MFLRALLAGAGLLWGSGCATSTLDSNQSSGQEELLLPSVVSIVLADSTELTDGTMIVQVYEGGQASATPATFFLTGSDGPKGWQANGGFELSTLTSGSEVELEVVETPFEALTANVGTSFKAEDMRASESATAGKVTLLLDTSAPNVRGSVSATPTSMSATFSGTFWLWCHYAGPSGESMLDEAFETPFCQQFSMWKPVGQEGPPTVGY